VRLQSIYRFYSQQLRSVNVMSGPELSSQPSGRQRPSCASGDLSSNNSTTANDNSDLNADSACGKSTAKLHTTCGDVAALITKSVIVNETLCFVFDKFACAASVNLKAILCSFYSEDELVSAKTLLVNCVDSVQSNVLPRFSKRRPGEGRIKGTVDDILEIMAICDEKDLLEKLPNFAAIRLARVPTIKTEDMELFSCVYRLNCVEERLAKIETFQGMDKSLENKISDFEKRIDSCEKGATGVDNKSYLGKSEGQSTSHLGENDGQSSHDGVEPIAPKGRWADVAKNSAEVLTDGFTIVHNRKNDRVIRNEGTSNHARGIDNKPKKNKIFGVKTITGECSIKPGIAIVRKTVLHLDNLGVDCTADCLKSFIASLSVNVISCFECKSWMRDAEVSKVCSFRVCIDAKDKDKV
jgi:hypothetical protein